MLFYGNYNFSTKFYDKFEWSPSLGLTNFDLSVFFL